MRRDRSRFKPRIGRSRDLSRPWSASTRFVGIPVGDMAGGGASSEQARVDWRPVRAHLARCRTGAQRTLEGSAGRLAVPAPAGVDIDDLPELVAGPVQVAPCPVDLHVGLVDLPAVPGRMPAGPGGVDDQGVTTRR